METTPQLPQPLQSLVDAGRLRKVDDSEYAITGLSFRHRTWLGPQKMTYTLELNDDDEAPYAIIEESTYSGEDCVLTTSDPNEVADWIAEMIAANDWPAAK